MGHILVVDDYPANRELLSKRLERMGHTVVQVGDGAEALEQLKKEPFDLILLDILMPVMSGYDVLAELKKDPELQEIPVIVISAVDDTDSIVKCIELGATDYLTKPFNPVILKARVAFCLEKKTLHDKERKEKARVDELLNAIFPPQIVEELKTTETVAPKYYENAAILFCDVVEFTQYCNAHTPEDVVENLQILAELFENLALKNNVLKIKTTGDSFLCVGGILTKSENPVLDCVKCGLELVEKSPTIGAKWEVRIGIHIGPVMAGVIGHRQYRFDVWGDTVNIAWRLAEQGSIGHVTLSEKAMQAIEDLYETVSIGRFPIKGIGNTEIYQVAGTKKSVGSGA